MKLVKFEIEELTLMTKIENDIIYQGLMYGDITQWEAVDSEEENYEETLVNMIIEYIYEV